MWDAAARNRTPASAMAARNRRVGRRSPQGTRFGMAATIRVCFDRRFDMDRRTFLELALSAPLLGQGAAPTRPAKAPATPAKPAAPPPAAGVAWTQWGGPHRNFQTEATRLERHLAGGRAARGLEAAARRRLFVAGRRGRRALHDVRQARARRSCSPPTPRPAQTLWEHVGADDVPERRGAGDGQRPVLDAAHRRRPAVHDRRRRPPAVPRQEVPASCSGRSSSGPTIRARG